MLVACGRPSGLKSLLQSWRSPMRCAVLVPPINALMKNNFQCMSSCDGPCMCHVWTSVFTKDGTGRFRLPWQCVACVEVGRDGSGAA